MGGLRGLALAQLAARLLSAGPSPGTPAASGLPAATHGLPPARATPPLLAIPAPLG
jgi:hypothetical protein